MKKTYVFIIMVASNIVLLAQPAAISTLPYSQDFEGSTFLPTDWQAFGSNTNAAWEHNTSVGAYGNSSGSAFFDNFTGNLAGNYYGMRAVSLDLTNSVKPTMKFDVAYAKRDASTSDILGIWYSFNGTTGWQNLQNFQDNSLATATDQNSFFTPNPSDWDSITIDLSQFAGNALIRLAFENHCQNGNVIYIDNVRFYDSQFVGINNPNSSNSTIAILPNPSTNGHFQISSEKELITQIRLMDKSGREVLNENVEKKNNHMIQTSNYQSGMYFLQVYFQGQSFEVKKVIIN